MARAVKKNLSGLQVMKTLLVLLQGNFSMQEIVKRLNAGEETPVFNNSVVSKYINTCRACGIDIPKIHNKYFVTNMIFGLDLTCNDVCLLENIQNVVREYMGRKVHKNFNEFVEKLNRFSNKKITRVEKDIQFQSAEYFETAVNEKRKIRLMLLNKDILDCIPIRIAENKGKRFFQVIHNDKEKLIDSDKVSGIEVLNQRFYKNYTDLSVVYVLKGELACRYTIRENEQLVFPTEPGTITISNRGENKELLFSRLLRYDNLCEIITPKSYREEMKQILDSALQNYGEE